MAEVDFRALSFNRDLMWKDVAEIDWGSVPFGPDEQFKEYARDVAGKARSFGEFYLPENRAVQWAVEQWLTRYSELYTHPDLRT